MMDVFLFQITNRLFEPGHLQFVGQKKQTKYQHLVWFHFHSQLSLPPNNTLAYRFHSLDPKSFLQLQYNYIF